MYKLILKGGKVAALNYCRDYTVDVLTIVPHARFDQTTVTIRGTVGMETLAEWFWNHGKPPYPYGTLLWYGPLTDNDTEYAQSKVLDEQARMREAAAWDNLDQIPAINEKAEPGTK